MQFLNTLVPVKARHRKMSEKKTHRIGVKIASQNLLHTTWLLLQILEDIRQVKFLSF